MYKLSIDPDDICAPEGYVQLRDAIRTMARNEYCGAPWGVDEKFDVISCYTNIKPIALDLANKKLEFIQSDSAVVSRLERHLRQGLFEGKTLFAAAVVIDNFQMTYVPPIFWRMPVLAGEHQGKCPLSVAFEVGVVNLLPNDPDQAPAVPMLKLRDLALHFGARNPPPEPPNQPFPWLQWLFERRSLATASPSRAERKSGRRGRPPSFDWDEFWAEVVLRLGWRDLDRTARAKLVADMKDWFLLKDEPLPDDRTVERKFEKLRRAERSAAHGNDPEA